MAAHRCMVCNRIVMPGEWVCDACENAYGLAGPFREWPETRASRHRKILMRNCDFFPRF